MTKTFGKATRKCFIARKKVQPLDVMLAIQTPSLTPTDALIANFSSLFRLKLAVVWWVCFY